MPVSCGDFMRNGEVFKDVDNLIVS
jgi:hypothetical protein